MLLSQQTNCLICPDTFRAVEGAAYVGNEDLVFDLLARGANIDFATRGAACSGNDLIQFADELIIRGGSLSSAAEGAALGGHYDYAKKLIWRSTSKAPSESFGVWGASLKGAAHGGHWKFVVALLQQSDVNINYALSGAASGGHYEMFKILLGFIPEENKQKILPIMCEYAAREGNIGILSFLFSQCDRQQVAASYAAYGAAAGGNLEIAMTMLSYKADLTFAVRGAMNGFEIEILNRLLTKGEVVLDLITSEAAAKKYLASKDTLRLLSFVDSPRLRRLLADKTEEINPKFVSHSLFSKSTKVNELIRKYELTFYQALAYLKMMAHPSFSWFLLYGHKFFGNANMPIELYYKVVVSMIGKLDREMKRVDAENIFFVAHTRLRDRVIADSTTGFYSFFKKAGELEVNKKRAEARYQIRMKYL